MARRAEPDCVPKELLGVGREMKRTDASKAIEGIIFFAAGLVAAQQTALWK